MRTATHRTLSILCVLLATVALTGCVNPDAPKQPDASRSASTPQNAGEPPAPAPPTASSQKPASVKSTPEAAIEAFSRLYSNWTYRTLTSNQRTLARLSVGAARLAEQQAAASAQADTTISQGHIWNQGQIVSIATDRTQHGAWVLVTREQTGGSTQYAGLPASYHVTRARLVAVQGGYAVSEWLPQN